MNEIELIDYIFTYWKYDKVNGLFFWKKRPKQSSIVVGSPVGYKTKNGYIRVFIRGKGYMVHRLVWLKENGILPIHKIDHINHKRDDNKISNLRDVIQLENDRNQSLPSSNTSGAIGVSWHKKYKRWYARIKIDSKQIHLGSFASFSEAVDAHKNAEVLYGYHENHGREK